jgi:erythrocyte band 7 integral membrane protein
MATEAEATREARAKVIDAEGEQKASIALAKAADVINQNPVALQLRYLQTLGNLADEKVRHIHSIYLFIKSIVFKSSSYFE